LAALEAEAAGAEDLQHLQRTILSTEQLSDAEAAIQSLGGARLSQVVGHYLNLEERAKAKDLSLDSAMEFVESRYRPELEEISVLNARTAFLGTRRGRSERTVQFYESCTRKLLHPDPVVSRNSITTEGADFQIVGRGGLRATSHRAPRCRTVRLRQWR
jgi:hypothetical protein